MRAHNGGSFIKLQGGSRRSHHLSPIFKSVSESAITVGNRLSWVVLEPVLKAVLELVPKGWFPLKGGEPVPPFVETRFRSRLFGTTHHGLCFCVDCLGSEAVR